MHAGISPAFSAYNYDFAEVNFILRNFLYSDFTILPNSPEENILGGNGPLWFRGYMNYGERAPQVEQRFIDNYLDSVQVEIMFLGHNEQKEISSSYEGKVISLDVFINESGETAQGLLIKNQKLIRCHADGSQEEIK